MDHPRRVGTYSPQILVGINYVPRQSEKCGQGLRNKLPVERDNVGLRGTSLSRFELKGEVRS